MKRIILITALAIVSFCGFSQSEGVDLNINNAKLNNRLYGNKSGGLDTLIVPDADSIGQYNFMNLADPVNDLDGVNLRTLNENTFTQPLDSASLNPDIVALDFNEYTIWADTAKHTITVYLGESEISPQLFLENYVIGYNGTGSTILNGTPVYLDSCSICPFGSFKLAIANDIDIAAQTVGVATHDIEDLTIGFATKFGLLTEPSHGFSIGVPLYVSETTAGDKTESRPMAPDYNVRIGGVISDSVLFIDVVPFDRSDTEVNIEGILNGIITQKQAITDVTITGTTYFETYNEDHPTKDLPFLYGGDIEFLNTTTNTGTSGYARVALTNGTATESQVNYVYIDYNSGNPQLAISTTAYPATGVRVAELGLFDNTTHLAHGFSYIQRFNNSINGSEADGWINKSAKRIRLNGSEYASGVDPTVTLTTVGAAIDSLDISTTSGVVWQFNEQTASATSGNLYLWTNSPTGEQWITDLSDVNVDANGNSLRDDDEGYVLTLFFVQNSGSYDDHIIVTSPSSSYNIASPFGNTQSDVANDINNTAITTVPTKHKKTAIRLARIPIEYETGNGGTLINLADIVFSLDYLDDRGQLLGSSGGGGGAASPTTNFSDADFSVYNTVDATKIVDLDVSGITTGNTRTLTIPDANGTIVLGSGTANTLTKFNGINSVTNSGITENGATVDFGALDLTTTGAVEVGELQSNGNIYLLKESVSGSGYNVADVMSVEDNGSFGATINIIANPTDNSQFLFSDDVRARGGISYEHAGNRLSFRVNSTNDIFSLESNGNATFISTVTHDAPTLSTQSALLSDVQAAVSSLDHSALTNLDYASAGHTDFVSTTTTQSIGGSKTFTLSPTFNNGIWVKSSIHNSEVSVPATPGAGIGVWYVGTDGKFYGKNDGGTVYDLTGAGGATDLSLGTITATTIDVNSSTGTNATLLEANTTQAGILGSDKWDEIVDNSAFRTTPSTVITAGTNISWTGNTLNVTGGSGDVTKVGTPVDNQVGIWTGDGTLEGDADLTFSGTTLTATNIGTGQIGAVDGSLKMTFASGATGSVTFNDQFINANIGSAPTPSAGMQYYNTNDSKLYSYIGGSWVDLGQSGGSGNVSNTGTPVNDQIAVWTDATTIEGTSFLKLNGNTLEIDNTVPALKFIDGTDYSSFVLNGDATSFRAQGSDVWVYDVSDDYIIFKTQALAYKYTTASAASQSLNGTLNLDTRSNADAETITLTGNSTLNIDYIEDGQAGEILVRQDATGSRTLAIVTFSDAHTTGLTEIYSGGLELINPEASSYTSINYKRLGSIVKIDVVYYE